ncbi:MAG: sialate O-acetylesterase, partial [Phycisphaerales bacterium]
GSGQSNMAMTVQSSNDFEKEKAAANFPLIRHYKQSSGPADRPQAEGKAARSAARTGRAAIGRFLVVVSVMAVL